MEIQLYPDGTPTGTDKVPYIEDPAGTPALKLAAVSDLGGGGGIEGALTVWLNSSNYTTNSTSFVDIDATNLPALSLTLASGDVVELTFAAPFGCTSNGQPLGVDWLIDRPTSGDTNLRGSAFAAATIELASAGTDCNTITCYGLFLATEAGAHSFKPQWRASGGATAIIPQTGTYTAPVFHFVKRLPG